MKEIFGKQVYEFDHERLEPAHTALVVIDMQNDFVAPEGVFAKAGRDLGALAEIVPRIGALVDEARVAGVTIVWVQHSTLPNGLTDSPAWLAFKTRSGPNLEYTLAGTWGQELVDGLNAHPEDLRVTKSRSNAFVGTALEQLLHANGIQSAVFCGCLTDGCVEATARDALFRDLYVDVVEDCVASIRQQNHDESLAAMRRRLHVNTSTFYLAQWGRPAVDKQ